MRLVWNPELTVGNLELDQHHQNLFRILDETYNLVINKQDSDSFTTIKIISELKVYTIFHFHEEEKLMQRGNYPDYENHKRIHQDFITKINDLKERISLDTIELNEEIYILLSSWLVEHIQNEDQKYKSYIH